MNICTYFPAYCWYHVYVFMQLKEKVAEKFDVVLEQICLIHSGKILCDSEELIGCGITDETVVHMVVKSAGAQVCNDKKSSLLVYH